MFQDEDTIDKVLLFHDVDTTSRIGMQELNSRYLMSWKKFQQIFDLNQYQTDTFETIESNLSLTSIKSITRITVDDGGGSSFQIAKFLKNKNIKAYFFIVTDFIGKPNFLCEDEIKQIYEMGHVIGSHSHTHPHPFNLLTNDQIRYEINKSKDILEKLLNVPIKIFSVPGGEISKRVLRTLSDPIMSLDEIYISTPYKGLKKFKFSNLTKIYGRLCIEADTPDLKISKYILGKGWSFALINYQVRRFRREILYRLNIHS
tara:strand:- start:1578 stop:2354 length:777 start_codon:yes stop_codon:yes gene_type:complete